MPLYRLLQNCAFEPDTIKMMGMAFDEACQALALADSDDAARDRVAKRIIELAQQGERNGERLRERALADFRAK